MTRPSIDIMLHQDYELEGLVEKSISGHEPRGARRQD
jgi:hypothetical protein